jgi:hypothetical protein
LQDFKRWVSRLSVAVLIAAFGGLPVAVLFGSDRGLRIVSSFLGISLALLARRAIAKLGVDTLGSLDTLQFILNLWFVFWLVGAVYMVWREPYLSSLPGAFLVTFSILLSVAAFWFARQKISDVRMQTTTVDARAAP